MTMPGRAVSRLDVFMAATVLTAVPAVLWSLIRPGPVPEGAGLVLVVLLALGVAFGELVPIEIARKGRQIDQLTISTTLALALVLIGPLGWAIVAQSVPLVIDDLRRGKHWSRPVFNVAQYSLTFAASKATFLALSGDRLSNELAPAQLPAALAAAVVFFAVNQLFVGTAVALWTGTSLRDQMREDGPFQLGSAGVLALLAPLVVVVAQFSLALAPMLALPLIAVRSSARMAVRKQYDALHDVLTGLPNRSLLQFELERRLEEVAEKGPLARGLAVLLIDLDRFKEINDTLGHQAGDLLLVEVGARLKEVVTAGTGSGTGAHTIARLGGDEFAVMLELDGLEVEWADAVARAAHLLREALQETVVLADVRLSVQASIGVAVSPWHGDTVSELLARADVALYTAKKDRDGWVMYEPLHDTHSPERLALLSELRDGIDENQLVVYYQPKCSAATRRLHSVEALVRWQHPTRGLLAPDVFIPVAESTGIITPLTIAVLDAAIRQGRAWLDAGRAIPVAVNLSARSLSDSHLSERVNAVLLAHGLPARLLTLEVTESTIMADPPRATANLARLRALGVRLAIDDYGTGYSSLTYLQQLDADELKIDKSFIFGLRVTDGDVAVVPRSRNDVIVRSTIELGRSLGMTVVAEGVEDENTWAALAALHCDVVQGYVMTQPLPGAEFDRWLREWEGGTGTEVTSPLPTVVLPDVPAGAGLVSPRGRRVTASDPEATPMLKEVDSC